MLDERRKLSFLHSQGLPFASVAAFGPMQLQPRIIAVWFPVALATRSSIALGLLAVTLAGSAAFPALNPFDAFYNRWVRPRVGGESLGPAQPPRRFAQALASLMLGATTAMVAAGWPILTMVVAAPFALAVALVVLRGFCVGAYLYHALRRLHRAHRGTAAADAPAVTPRSEA